MSVHVISSRDEGSDICRLTVAGDATIYQAEELKQSLLVESASAQHIECDLSGVEDFDASGLQVLLALAKTLELRDGSVIVQGQSACVSAYLSTLGLSSSALLGLGDGGLNRG